MKQMYLKLVFLRREVIAWALYSRYGLVVRRISDSETLRAHRPTIFVFVYSCFYFICFRHLVYFLLVLFSFVCFFFLISSVFFFFFFILISASLLVFSWAYSVRWIFSLFFLMLDCIIIGVIFVMHSSSCKNALG